MKIHMNKQQFQIVLFELNLNLNIAILNTLLKSCINYCNLLQRQGDEIIKFSGQMRFKCIFDQTFKDQYKPLVAATFGCICLIKTANPLLILSVEIFRLNLNWGNNWARRRFSPNDFWLHFNAFFSVVREQMQNLFRSISSNRFYYAFLDDLHGLGSNPI